MKRHHLLANLCSALCGVALLGTACSPSILQTGAPAPLAAAGADDGSVASFYYGKTVRILTGFAPGGGFDTYSRLIARHLGKHIPGNPNVIVENLAGDASAAAAREVFTHRPKDGTVIASFNENLVLLQALNGPPSGYDIRRFQFLGTLSDSPSVCIFRRDTGIESFADLLAGREASVGANGPGSILHDVPAVLREALGANLRIVDDYNGTAQIRLAMERGQLDGGCWTWDSMSVNARGWFEQSPPFVRALVALGTQPPDHPWLRETPAAVDFAPNDLARQVLLGITLPSQIGKPLAVAPEVPPARVAALRQALQQALADPELQADTQRWAIEIKAKPAAEVEARVRQILDLSPEAKARLRQALGR